MRWVSWSRSRPSLSLIVPMAMMMRIPQIEKLRTISAGSSMRSASPRATRPTVPKAVAMIDERRPPADAAMATQATPTVTAGIASEGTIAIIAMHHPTSPMAIQFDGRPWRRTSRCRRAL